MVRRELNTERPLPVDDHAMKVIVLIDLAAKSRAQKALSAAMSAASNTVICLTIFIDHSSASCRTARYKQFRTVSCRIDSGRERPQVWHARMMWPVR